ncbi:MAG: DUF433 domain-containing protein [Verrucomicrobia bacterium]|nr:DUF433 domain-containing protein [Verrucomicrobiota bacterium]MDA1005091.1 DUF433 domain-containing protein [Verrucomicrobiota bacterium]
MSEVVRNPEVLGGLPVFRGTRVPIRNLFDYIVRGGTVEVFLEDFPTVSFEQVRQVLQAAEVAVEGHAA